MNLQLIFGGDMESLRRYGRMSAPADYEGSNPSTSIVHCRELARH